MVIQALPHQNIGDIEHSQYMSSAPSQENRQHDHKLAPQLLRLLAPSRVP